MRTTPRLSLLSLALAAALTPAHAQTTAPASGADAEKLDKVVVTARKREESLKDVPVAVTALNAEALDRMNVKNLGDLQGNVPNLTIYAARGSNTTLTTFIRGVGQADPLWGVDPGVGIYLDDAYIARPQGALLEVFDTQRIEVLRGPQGTLYGKNTIGGAVKYVSKPLAVETNGQAGLTMGSHGTLQMKGSVGGSAMDGQMRVRVAAASLNRDGYGQNLTDGSDVSNQKTDAGRVALGWFPKDSALSLQAAADRTRDNSNMRGFQRLAVNNFEPAPRTPAGGDRYDIRSGMPNKNSTTSGGHSFTANLELGGDWRMKFIHSYRSSSTDTGIDFDGLPNKIADVLASYQDVSRSNELQLAGGNGVIGLYRFEGRAGGRVRNNFFNLLFGDTNGRVETTGSAIFGEWDWELTPALSLTTGLRYTQEEKHAVVLNRSYSNDQFTTPTTTSANFDKTRKVSNTAPKLALAWELSPQTSLYATLSRGFKSGGYNIRANAAAVPSTAEPFDDEILDSLELGAKMSFGNELEINSAVFFNKYKNVQLSIFSSYIAANGQPAFIGDFRNAGKADVNGLELEFVWRPSTQFTLRGNAAYTDAKYKEYIDRGVNVASQKWFSNTPKTSGALHAEVRFGAPKGEMRASLGVSYRSKVYPTTDLSEVIAQPGYTLVNAGLIWELDKQLSYSLQGTNLTDKAYRTDGYNIAALGVLSGFYGPPRTVTVSANYRF